MAIFDNRSADAAVCKEILTGAIDERVALGFRRRMSIDSGYGSLLSASDSTTSLISLPMKHSLIPEKLDVPMDAWEKGTSAVFH